MKITLRTAYLLLAIAAVVGFAAPLRAQTLYVSSGTNSIDTVNPTGSVHLFATTLTTTIPTGLAFDSSGNLYVAENGASQIDKITPGGSVSLYATLLSGWNPFGLAIDVAGNIYTANGAQNNSFSGYILQSTPTGGLNIYNSLPYSDVRGLAFDGSGHLWTDAQSESQVVGFGTSASYNLASAGPAGPFGLAFDNIGNLFVVDDGTSHVTKITPDGTVSDFATLPAGSFAQGVAIDGNNNLYVADTNLNEISKITPDGTVSAFVTGITRPTFLTFAPAPEPGSAVLVTLGGLGLFAARRRR